MFTTIKAKINEVMKALILISLLHCVFSSDIILPVLLQASNRTNDNVRDSISSLLQYSNNMSLHQSSDTSENVDVIYIKSSSSNSSRQGYNTSNGVKAAANVNKTSSLVTRVQKMYNNFELPKLENFRFHVILDQIIPDLSFFKHVCPGECEGCQESYAEVFCRLCCQDQRKEPMSISFLTDHFDYIREWLSSSEVFRGLKAIYNNVIGRSMRNADQHVFNPQEINTFIRNFHWHRSNSLDPNPVVPEDLETDLNRSSFEAPDICGYYEQGESRADQGRIVGGEEVNKLSMFPWQMSLSTGFLGLYYQHRYSIHSSCSSTLDILNVMKVWGGLNQREVGPDCRPLHKTGFRRV